MNPSELVYQKTAQGSTALAQRDAALGIRQRSVLILLDGKRTVADLAALSTALGDTPQLLAELQSLGMIELVHAPATRSAAPAPRPPADAALAASLPAAQRVAARRLTELMGPAAEDLCLRIEATRSPQEFAQAVKRAGEVLREFGGPQMAAAFARDVQAGQMS